MPATYKMKTQCMMQNEIDIRSILGATRGYAYPFVSIFSIFRMSLPVVLRVPRVTRPVAVTRGRGDVTGYA